MFVASIAAILAVIIAFSTNDKRRSMLGVAKKTEIAVAKDNQKPVVQTQEQKNFGALNAVLYIGCFFVIASMIGFVSYTDNTLVPSIILGITLLSLIVSWFLRLKVPFLKSSALAFNISGLVMFIFWFSALSEIGFEGFSIPLITFSMFLFSSIVSAKVFKLKGLYCVAYITGIPLILSSILFIGERFRRNTGADYESIIYYLAPAAYMISAVLFRYLWRSNSKLLSEDSKYFAGGFSIAYAIIGSIMSITMLFSEASAFSGSIGVFLLLIFFYVDYSLSNKSLVAIRTTLQALLITVCFDFLVLIKAEQEVSGYLLVTVMALSTIAQAIASFVIMIKKPTEQAHRAERISLAFSAVLFTLTALLCHVVLDDNTAPQNLSSFDTFSFFLLICKLFCVIFSALLCIVSIFIDRNAHMLIPAALSLVSIVCNNSFEPLFCAIIIGITSLVTAFSYFAIKPADKENAMAAALVASISLSVLSFFYCLNEGSGYWIPIILASAIVLVSGYASKKITAIDWGYYLCAAGVGLMLSSIVHDSDDLDLKSLVNYIAWLLVPIALLVRDYIHTKVAGGYRKNHPQFIIGAIALWLITANYVNLANFSHYATKMTSIQNPVIVACYCISIICQLGTMLYAFYTRITGMKVLNIIILVYTILGTFSYNIWGCLLVVGIALIGFAILAIYRASKKEQIIPVKKNTDIQVEKVENPDKKTLA